MCMLEHSYNIPPYRSLYKLLSLVCESDPLPLNHPQCHQLCKIQVPSMAKPLKYIIFALLHVALASPLNGLQTRDTFVWASVGDSWASGVSFDGKNTDYDENKNGCLRWKNSYGPLMEADSTWTTKPQEFHFAACSGARLDNIAVNGQGSNPIQMSQVGNPMMITYHAGGNNCDFGSVVANCIYPTPAWNADYDKAYPDPDGQCAKNVANTNGYINGMGMHGLYSDELLTVQGLLKESSVKNNPDFRLYILGYAHFFNVGSNYCDDESFAPQAAKFKNLGYHPPTLTSRLRTDFNDAIQRVNNILEKVAKDVNDPRVKYIDISPAFNTHRFCEDHHNLDDQWYSTDVWLWNLNFASQDPPADPSLMTAWITKGTLPDGVSLNSLNGTVGIEGSAGGQPWIQRPFHPKIGGTGAIKDYVIAAAKADKIPGVVGAPAVATGSSPTTPCVKITIGEDCVYQYQTLSTGQACPTSVPPLPPTCAGPLPFAAPTTPGSSPAYSSSTTVSSLTTTAPPSSAASVYCSNPSLEDGDGLCTCNVGNVTFTTFTPSGGPGNSCQASTIVPPAQPSEAYTSMITRSGKI